MATLNPEMLSSFGKKALKLDQDFSELERIAGQMERLSIESDHGFD